MKKAVIGIGSNSVRMLITEIEGTSGRRLLRDREGTRLFAGLDAAGNLQQEAMDTTVAAVKRMADTARAAGCDEVLLFATSATRDAANQELFAQRLHTEAQVELLVISGEEEAALSFLGATGQGRCGVIDIGGGSTEVIIGERDDLECAFSCQMGAVRFSKMLPLNSAQDMEPVILKAEQLLAEKLPTGVQLPTSWFATGGTFTTLATLTRGGSWENRTGIHGMTLTQSLVAAIGTQLADMSIEERRRQPGLQPARADIIVHGICILLACMKHMKIDSITVSEYGNLDGYTIRHYGLDNMK